jgi:hypothetical protein
MAQLAPVQMKLFTQSASPAHEVLQAPAAQA